MKIKIDETENKTCLPFMKQVFYVLLNKEDKYFFCNKTSTHIFTAPLLLNSMIFKNKELAVKFKKENKLKKFLIIKVIPQYFYEK